MSLLEQNNIKKKQVEKIPELNIGNKNSNKYKVMAVFNSIIHANKLKWGHLLGFYYFVAWKGCFKEENI